MKKTFKEWEVVKGLFSIDTTPANNSNLITEEQFDNAFRSNVKGFSSVNMKDRIEFLKKYGYEVNRDNLVNPNLSAKTKPEK